MVRNSSTRRNNNKPYQNRNRNQASLKILPRAGPRGEEKHGAYSRRDEFKTSARYDSAGSSHLRIDEDDMDRAGMLPDQESEPFIPDHCWVGEYLDSEDEKDTVPLAYDKSVISRTRDSDFLGITHQKPEEGQDRSIRSESSKKYQPFTRVSADSSRLSFSSQITGKAASLSPPPPPPLPKKLQERGTDSVNPSHKDVFERQLLSSLRTLLVDSDIAGALERTAQPVEVYDYGHGNKSQSRSSSVSKSQDTGPLSDVHKSTAGRQEVARSHTGGVSSALTLGGEASCSSIIPKKRPQADRFSNIPVIVKDRKSPALKAHSPRREGSPHDPDDLTGQTRFNKYGKLQRSGEKTSFQDPRSGTDQQPSRETQQPRTDRLSDLRGVPVQSPLHTTLGRIKLQKPVPRASLFDSSSGGSSFSSPHKSTLPHGQMEDSMNYIPVHGGVSSIQEFPIEVRTSVCRPRDKQPRLDDDRLGVSPAETCVEPTGKPAIQTQLKIKPVFKNFRRSHDQNTHSALITVSPGSNASGKSDIPTTSRTNQNVSYRGSFNDTRKVLLQEDKAGRSHRGIRPEDVADRGSVLNKEAERKDEVPTKRALERESLTENVGGFPFSKSIKEEEDDDSSDKYSDISVEEPIFDDSSDDENGGKYRTNSKFTRHSTEAGKMQSRRSTQFAQKKQAQKSKHFAFKLSMGGVRGGPFKKWMGGRNTTQVRKKNKKYAEDAKSGTDQMNAGKHLTENDSEADDADEHRSTASKSRFHQHQHAAKIKEVSSGWDNRGKTKELEGKRYQYLQSSFSESGRNNESYEEYSDAEDRFMDKPAPEEAHNQRLDFDKSDDFYDRARSSRMSHHQKRIYQDEGGLDYAERRSRYETQGSRQMHHKSEERNTKHVDKGAGYRRENKRSRERSAESNTHQHRAETKHVMERDEMCQDEPYEQRSHDIVPESGYWENARRPMTALKDDYQPQQKLPWKQHKLDSEDPGRKIRESSGDYELGSRETMDIHASTSRYVHRLRQHRSGSRDNLRHSDGEKHQSSRSRSRDTDRSSSHLPVILQQRRRVSEYRGVDTYRDEYDWPDKVWDNEELGLEKISSGEEFDMDDEETTDTMRHRRTHQEEGGVVGHYSSSKRHKQVLESWNQGVSESKLNKRIYKTEHMRERAENRNWDRGSNEPVRQVKSGETAWFKGYKHNVVKDFYHGRQDKGHHAEVDDHDTADNPNEPARMVRAEESQIPPNKYQGYKHNVVEDFHHGGHDKEDHTEGDGHDTADNINEPARMVRAEDSQIPPNKFQRLGVMPQTGPQLRSLSPLRSSEESSETTWPHALKETRIVISKRELVADEVQVDDKKFNVKQLPKQKVLPKMVPGNVPKSPFKPKLKRGPRISISPSPPAKEPRKEALSKDTRIIVSNDKPIATNDETDALSHEALSGGNASAWIGEYKAWFQDALYSKLRQDERATESNLQDPLVFLQSVTKGNKRSMAYIQRGDGAKQMLKFIALNKRYGTTSTVDEKELSGSSVDGFNGKKFPAEVVQAEELQLPAPESQTNICQDKEQPFTTQSPLQAELGNLNVSQIYKSSSEPGVIALDIAKDEETLDKLSRDVKDSDKGAKLDSMGSQCSAIVSEENNEKSADNRTVSSVDNQSSSAVVAEEMKVKTVKKTLPQVHGMQHGDSKTTALSKKEPVPARKQKVIQANVPLRKKPAKSWESSIIPPEEANLLAKTSEKTECGKTAETGKHSMPSKSPKAMPNVTMSENTSPSQRQSGDFQGGRDKSKDTETKIEKSQTSSKSPKAKPKTTLSKEAISPLQQSNDSLQDKDKSILVKVNVEKSYMPPKSPKVKTKVTTSQKAPLHKQGSDLEGSKCKSKEIVVKEEKSSLLSKSPKAKREVTTSGKASGLSPCEQDVDSLEDNSKQKETANMEKISLLLKSANTNQKVTMSKQTSLSLHQPSNGSLKNKDTKNQQKSSYERPGVQEKESVGMAKAFVLHSPQKHHGAAGKSKSTLPEKTAPQNRASAKIVTPTKSSQKFGQGKKIPKSAGGKEPAPVKVKEGKVKDFAKASITKTCADKSKTSAAVAAYSDKEQLGQRKAEIEEKVVSDRTGSMTVVSNVTESGTKEKQKKTNTKDQPATIKPKSEGNKSVDELKEKGPIRKASPRTKPFLDRQMPSRGTAGVITKGETKSSRPNFFESTSNRVKRSSLDHEELIKRPDSKPHYTQAHRKLLPIFKQFVENRVIKNLNVLYKFENYRKLKVVNTANDVLSMFHNEHRKPKFTTSHAVYQIWELFENPSKHVLDEMDKRLKRVHLEKPYFNIDLEALLLFQKTVFQLCYEYLQPNVKYSEQTANQLRYVRLYSEYLFPQFHGEAVGMMMLWTWSERVYWAMAQEDHLPQGSRSKVPFSSDYVGNSSVEDALTDWLIANVKEPIYEMSETAGCVLVNNVDDQLQKRGDASTKQTAMLLIIRTWVGCLLSHLCHQVPVTDKQDERVTEQDDSESDDLIILDEVYSDESGSESDKVEFEVDLSDETSSVSSVQIIDLF